MYDRLRDDYYRNPLPFPEFVSAKVVMTLPAPERARRDEMKRAYRERDGELNDQFRVDALLAVGLAARGSGGLIWPHPRAAKAWQFAWDLGHSYGLHEVFVHLVEIADVLIGD